jgi:hypothetical protein
LSDEEADVLREAMAALRMPPAALGKWLRARRDFCLAHGGRRHYAEVLDLVEACLRQAERAC